MSLREIAALRVNGQETCLHKVLKLARLRNSFSALDEKVEMVLLNQAASELNIEVTDEDLQAAVDQFRFSQGLYSAADTTAWLKRSGIELEDLEELFAAKVIGGKIRETVSTGEIEKYFSENTLSFESALLSCLVMEEEGEIQELKYQIQEEGADFNSLAREYSIDEATRLAGGFMGGVARSALDPETEAAVFGALDGEIVGPYKVDQGYQLIKVEKINKPALTDNTIEFIKDILYSQWLANRRRKAAVEVALWEQL
jgi:putative peptide maturation system protein